MRIIELNFNAIKSKKEFLFMMRECFDLPSYYSFNFDSLDECMRDLSWILEIEVTILVNNLNSLKENNQELYFDINESLKFYKKFWSTCNNKNVVFLDTELGSVDN